MDRTTEIELVRRIFGYLDARTTAMTDHVHREPVLAYDCREHARRERRRLFRDEPLVLALSCDVARPGDFVTHDLTGVPIVLTRTRSGLVRAFVNVCRHRGARVVDGSGCGRQSFACPYHAWTYDCDGRLLGMGTTRGFEGVDREHHGLTALPVVERHGLVWVRPVPGAAPDTDALLQGMGTSSTCTAGPASTATRPARCGSE